MEISAIILATISLIISIAVAVFVLAKHYSTHTITYNPIEEEISKKKVDSFMEAFREIGEKKPLPIGDD